MRELIANRGQTHLSSPINIEHLFGFALLAIVFVAAYPQRVALVSSIALGRAVLLEHLQTFTLDRHGRLIDAIEKIIVKKIIGGSLGFSWQRGFALVQATNGRQL